MSARGAAAKDAAALRIGVTGHRPHRLKVSDSALMRRIGDVIALLARGAGKGPIEVVSALAEGADTLVARAALKSGCRLTALLPFAPDDYETTFSDAAHKPVFRKLMQQAHHRVVLPGSLRKANAGYEAVGLETLERSDVVLTIWDGGPAQGRGGTPEILQSALERKLPIVWISALEDRAPRLVRRAARGPLPRLENIARRSEPLAVRDAKLLSAT